MVCKHWNAIYQATIPLPSCEFLVPLLSTDNRQGRAGWFLEVCHGLVARCKARGLLAENQGVEDLLRLKGRDGFPRLQFPSAMLLRWLVRNGSPEEVELVLRTKFAFPWKALLEEARRLKRPDIVRLLHQAPKITEEDIGRLPHPKKQKRPRKDAACRKRRR